MPYTAIFRCQSLHFNNGDTFQYFVEKNLVIKTCRIDTKDFSIITYRFVILITLRLVGGSIVSEHKTVVRMLVCI